MLILRSYFCLVGSHRGAAWPGGPWCPEASTDPAGGLPGADSAIHPGLHWWFVLFFTAGEAQEKGWEGWKGDSPGFSTFQNLENKFHRLPRMQDPLHLTPPEAALLGRGRKHHPKQFNRPELSLHLPIWYKTSPFRYSNCFILMNHLKGFPFKNHGKSSVRIALPVVRRDQPNVGYCPCWMASVELLEIPCRATLASINSLTIDVNSIEFSFWAVLKYLSNYHYNLKCLKNVLYFPNLQ